MFFKKNKDKKVKDEYRKQLLQKLIFITLICQKLKMNWLMKDIVV